MPAKSLNRRGFCSCCLGAASWPVFARAERPDSEPEGLPQALELGTPVMNRIAKTVWVSRLAHGIWLHTTTNLIEGVGYYPANGLIIEREIGGLLIDTGYRPGQGEALFDWSKRQLAMPITQSVSTHFHSDRTGGIAGLGANGVATLASPLTCALAKSHGLPVPRPLKGFGAGPYILGDDCELFFPGAGHTADNIVVWLPRHRILFGGCLIKSVTSNGLGNVADAVVPAWAGTVRKVRDRYAAAKTVIPGHGAITGDPIARTLALLAA